MSSKATSGINRLTMRNALALYTPRAAVEHFTRALDAIRHRSTVPSPQLYRMCGLAHETLGAFDLARADLERHVPIDTPFNSLYEVHVGVQYFVAYISGNALETVRLLTEQVIPALTAPSAPRRDQPRAVPAT